MPPMMLQPACAVAPRPAVRCAARPARAARIAPLRASVLNASDPGSFEVCDVTAAFDECALLTGAAQQNCFAEKGCAAPTDAASATGAVNDVVVQCELANGDEAQQCWGIVADMTPPDSALHERAENKKQQLAVEGKRKKKFLGIF